MSAVEFTEWVELERIRVWEEEERQRRAKSRRR